LSSCSNFETNDKVLLARLGDSYLYEHQVKSMINSNLSAVDSSIFIQQYINNWAKEELLLKKAALNINQDQLEIDKRLESYRRSLLIHAYEQKLIEQSLDTIVLKDQLQLYYRQHVDDYLLADKIIKVIFVKTSIIAPKLDSLKSWLFDNDTLYIDAIETYCHQYAKRFYYNPNEWLIWSDFQQIFSNELDISSLSMKNNTMILKDTLDIYFIRLINLRDQGEIAPLEYVKEEIKSILLNQRKLKTVEVIKTKLFEDAKQSNQFEIY
tara:strand:+ start:1355 stop:2155 length:801 start_codon:yes stop_codon:yes gene_type:complete